MKHIFNNHFNFDLLKIEIQLNSFGDDFPKKIAYLKWLRKQTIRKYHCNYLKWKFHLSEFKNENEVENHIFNKLRPLLKKESEGFELDFIYSEHVSGNYEVHGLIPSLEPLIEFINEELDLWKDQLIFQKQRILPNESLETQVVKSKKMDTKENLEKIIWKKDKKDLIFLFDELVKLGFIAEHKHINKLISQHFNYNNSDIATSEIADLKSKLKKETYPLFPASEIKEIISKTKENSKKNKQK